MSALAPDGSSDPFWSTHVGNVQTLYACLVAIWEGVEPLAWFIVAIVIFIPKSAMVATDTEHRVAPGRYRPLTLANASQKLIAKAINVVLEDVARRMVSHLQLGVVEGRQMLDNVVDIEAAMEVFLHREGAGRGIFYFGVEAAFPSASQT